MPNIIFCPCLSLVIVAHSILIPSSTLQVAVKCQCHIKNPLQVDHRQRLILINRQRLCRSHSILDLPTIQGMLGQISVILFSERHRLNLLKNTNALNEELKDCFLGLWRELAVAESDVDTGLKGFVEGLNAIGCQEEDLGYLSSESTKTLKKCLLTP